MLVIKVWCLPAMKEDGLQSLHKSIVDAAASVERIGVRNEKDLLCLFPMDMMSYGLGEEILVEVSFVGTRKPRLSVEKWHMLNARMGSCIETRFPRARVYVESVGD